MGQQIEEVQVVALLQLAQALGIGLAVAQMLDQAGTFALLDPDRVQSVQVSRLAAQTLGELGAVFVQRDERRHRRKRRTRPRGASL
ncbi:MAG TPA: hypothetical protein VLR48_09140 [Thiocapsa sp.]|nr:hypothetical protein [Thiocapsa sp.]HSO82762.1 hypothetical protein [Thiocapsa sp.]